MALIGVDVGGTFTDLCLYDDQNETVPTVKTPTTSDDPAIGVRKGLTLLPLDTPAV